MHWVEGIAMVTVLLSIGCFSLYLVALLRMPTGRRPLITPCAGRLAHPRLCSNSEGACWTCRP